MFIFLIIQLPISTFSYSYNHVWKSSRKQQGVILVNSNEYAWHINKGIHIPYRLFFQEKSQHSSIFFFFFKCGCTDQLAEENFYQNQLLNLVKHALKSPFAKGFLNVAPAYPTTYCLWKKKPHTHKSFNFIFHVIHSIIIQWLLYTLLLLPNGITALEDLNPHANWELNPTPLEP